MSFESANTKLQLIESAENRVQCFSYGDGTHVELNFAGVEGLSRMYGRSDRPATEGKMHKRVSLVNKQNGHYVQFRS